MALATTWAGEPPALPEQNLLWAVVLQAVVDARNGHSLNGHEARAFLANSPGLRTILHVVGASPEWWASRCLPALQDRWRDNGPPPPPGRDPPATAELSTKATAGLSSKAAAGVARRQAERDAAEAAGDVRALARLDARERQAAKRVARAAS